MKKFPILAGSTVLAVTLFVACGKSRAPLNPTIAPQHSIDAQKEHTKALAGVSGATGTTGASGPTGVSGPTGNVPVPAASPVAVLVNPSTGTVVTPENPDVVDTDEATQTGSAAKVDVDSAQVVAPAELVDQPKKTGIKRLLSIFSNDPANFAILSLRGTDAERLYGALDLKEKKVKANDFWLEGKVREGVQIKCFQEFEKKAPTTPEYVCNLYMDYKSGEIRKFHHSVKILKQSKPGSYEGASLTLSPSSMDGVIVLAGADAEQLYGQLTVTADASSKRGKDVSCTQESGATAASPKETTCVIKIDSADGSVVQLSK
jgi:hypothetical protein